MVLPLFGAPSMINQLDIHYILHHKKWTLLSNNMGNFVIKKTTKGEYYFNLLADNSQIILTSQIYSSKSSCFNGIDLVRNSCSYDSYERKQTADNKYYFVLKAPNGQIIGNSQMYAFRAGMENGIESVKKDGNTTQVVEEEPYF